MGGHAWARYTVGYYLLGVACPLFSNRCVVHWVGCVRVYVWRYDAQYAISSGPHGQPYYWTNVYHWQQVSPDVPDDAVLGGLLLLAKAALPTYVYFVGWRAVSPTGVEHYPGVQPSGYCFAPFGGVVGPVHLIVRVDYYTGGRLSGYKRLRGAWAMGSQSDGVWIAPLLAYLRGSWAARHAALPLCSSSGSLFDSLLVRSGVYMWQVRHGSKRASRAVIAM